MEEVAYKNRSICSFHSPFNLTEIVRHSDKQIVVTDLAIMSDKLTMHDMDNNVSGGSCKSKRNAHLSPSSNLHIWVSQWLRKDVEKELHIFCSGTAITPSSMLEKITNEELSEKQSKYMEKVKRYLNFDIRFLELILCQSVAHYPATGITQHLKDVIKDTIERSMKDPDR